MGAKIYYQFVLLIYVALWLCQMFVCNSTHSLIVLTDSYINLYYIIEIILELFYLRVQSKMSCSEGSSSNYKIFSRTCTYQFKRLPLLGSFMNSVFLSALLMYAAIEGIQSCFHAHHLIVEGGKSILLQHKLTYPGLLVGFALVGILMRTVLDNIHKMRIDEDGSKKKKISVTTDKPTCCKTTEAESMITKQTNHSIDKANSQGDISLSQLEVSQLKIQSTQDNTTPGIMLKSIKLKPDHDDKINSVYITVDGTQQSPIDASKNNTVKYSISPIALIACALVVYLITDELVTEITDAVLAIVVVVVVYIASYPSIDYASRTLLQTAPFDLDLNTLISDLKSISPLVSSVEDLHVWSLTNDSGRIGSCNLLISKDNIGNDSEISAIIREARSKFLARGINCSSVQPVLFSAIEEATRNKEDKEKCCGESHHHHHHDRH